MSWIPLIHSFSKYLADSADSIIFQVYVKDQGCIFLTAWIFQFLGDHNFSSLINENFLKKVSFPIMSDEISIKIYR